MKTLALQKIEKRKNLVLRKIGNVESQYKHGFISYKEYVKYRADYKLYFVGYVRAFLDIDILTLDEWKQILDSFICEIQ